MSIIGEVCQALDESAENVLVCTNLAKKQIEEAIAAREELVKHSGDWVATLKNVHEELKKTMEMNIDLTEKNVNLQQELHRARRDALLQRKEALLQKGAAINMKIEMARARGAREYV